jgi:hypothetical protein
MSSVYQEQRRAPAEIRLSRITLQALADRHENSPKAYHQACAKAILAGIRGAITHGSRRITAYTDIPEVAWIVGLNLTPPEWTRVRLIGPAGEVSAAESQQYREDLLQQRRAVQQRPEMPSLETMMEQQSWRALRQRQAPDWEELAEAAQRANLQPVTQQASEAVPPAEPVVVEPPPSATAEEPAQLGPTKVAPPPTTQSVYLDDA